jgi:hypothetical protein
MFAAMKKPAGFKPARPFPALGIAVPAPLGMTQAPRQSDFESQLAPWSHSWRDPPQSRSVSSPSSTNIETVVGTADPNGALQTGRALVGGGAEATDPKGRRRASRRAASCSPPTAIPRSRTAVVIPVARQSPPVANVPFFDRLLSG